MGNEAARNRPGGLKARLSRGIAACAALALLVLLILPMAASPASASANDCFSYGYACTPGYTGGNAAGTWAWSYYGGSYAQTPNGYHNCTLYAAWRLQQAGLRSPGRSWGNAAQWAGSIGGGNHTPAVGSIAWWGPTPSNSFGHVAYVEQVSGGNVFIRADNWNSTRGFTNAGWIAASSVGLFLHPHDLSNGSPFGSFDGATGRVGGAVQVSGWTIDPDAPTIPTAVHVYIDGPAGSGARGVNLGLADVPRPDVGAANPGAGNNHGFNTTITGVSPGVHTLYAYAINAAGGGANPLLRTLQATVPGPDPIGRLDSAHGAVGGFIGVNGWTIDPDAPTTAGQVHVYIDGPAGSGARGVAVPAAVDRPDVAAAYPGAGPAHGYSSAIGGISPGPHKIWVYLINIAGGGSNPLLTTADVTVPAVAAGSPFGSFDGAADKGGGAAQVTGWTIDPDARTTPTQVHIYIDGPAGSGVRGVNLGLADRSRPDVGAAFPGSGDAHGFNTTITGLRPGVHTLWAYAINAAGGGANPLLRTLQVNISG
jgi:surface antigen